MALISLTVSESTYGPDFSSTIFSSTGLSDLAGLDFGDLETGEDSTTKQLFIRHDGIEPVYNVGFYIKSIGSKWGGYVDTAPTANVPFNPNFFRSGGINPDTTLPFTSTEDYEYMRSIAFNNPDMGIRLHMDRTIPILKSAGLGNANAGLNFSPLALETTALDYSKSANSHLTGFIYPDPNDGSKTGKDGDEALVGISIKLPEETVGSGHIEFSTSIKYRFTL